MTTASKEVISQIIQAQKEQIAKPQRACVNSESAFVAAKLKKQGFFEAADIYWNFTCGSRTLIQDSTVLELEATLKAIDNGFTMPVWGCSGT